MSSEPQTPQQPELSAQQLSEQEGIRRQKLQRLAESGQSPYAITHFPVTHQSAQILADFDALEGKTVRIAGRMVSKRVMGKASFAHLLDSEGQVQFYVRATTWARNPIRNSRIPTSAISWA